MNIAQLYKKKKEIGKHRRFPNSKPYDRPEPVLQVCQSEFYIQSQQLRGSYFKMNKIGQ